jgi:hypothetical protein
MGFSAVRGPRHTVLRLRIGAALASNVSLFHSLVKYRSVVKAECIRFQFGVGRPFQADRFEGKIGPESPTYGK